MPTFIKKPLPFKAIQLADDKSNLDEINEMLIGSGTKAIELCGDVFAGIYQAKPGEWIVRDYSGLVTVCSDYDFKNLYQQVEA